MNAYYSRIESAAEYLRKRIPVLPTLGIVLGSGWGGLIGGVERPIEIPYGDVPGMKPSNVPGHAGKWIFGRVNGVPCAIMSGRLHYYEGHSLSDVTLPIRVMKALGISTVVLTNAAGAVNLDFHPGDLMIMTDHINFVGANPLSGPNDDRLGERFPDMTAVYDKALIDIAMDVATGQQLPVRQGVYAWFNGPSFETPAEIRMVRTVGGDAVGMSTAPEVIVAGHCGMEVLGITLVSNMAAGILPQPLSEQEVLDAAAAARDKFSGLILACLKEL